MSNQPTHQQPKKLDAKEIKDIKDKSIKKQKAVIDGKEIKK